MNSLQIAWAFVEQYYPECRAAFLGADAACTGEPTSGLDILVITDCADAPACQPHTFRGWPVELAVHSESSLYQGFEADRVRRQPSLLRMCAEGIVLRNVDGTADRARQTACDVLEAGPPPLSDAEAQRFRCSLHTMVDDLEASEDVDESLFIIHTLVKTLVDFLLAENQRWGGCGRWALRALRELDAGLAEELLRALWTFYELGDPDALIGFVERQALRPATRHG
ncbi:MAG TPA: hypothetical protein PK801_06705 [Aggregatilineales bacterium]|nr:hypothetical protein [Chloroflexota bacterium]HOA22618.1 hypothetical protein [Aggregatilineales bacterium]HPV06856.1 hypothetical protein [Aggregatilineales bacterium]HQA67993.1 hypothetical protein [Aggregatilineales bacterium]HQE17122.1 hypothetical protein [Aggregatilineales bacterium]